MSESTGKTIDQLDPYSELTTAQKTQFKSTAVLPARGAKTQDGSLVTLKVPVEEFITQADNVTITNTAGVLSVANPVPSTTGYQKLVLTLDGNGNMTWGNPGDHLDIDAYGDMNVEPPHGIRSLGYASDSGGYYVSVDETTIEEVNAGTSQNPNFKLKVVNPLPSPVSVTDQGKVLTVNNSDEIVWAAPASGVPDPTGVTNGYVLTVSNGAATWAAPGGGGGGIVKYEVEYTTYPGDSYAFKGTAPKYSELLAACKTNNLVVVDLTWIGEHALNDYARFYFTSYSNKSEDPDYGICFTSWYNYSEDIFCLRMYQGDNDSILIYRYNPSN